ncbi:MAG: DUF952 domain-containing protein [Rhizobiales bacterium]|nr:DUF952 domain-containing protein [Hyphomicrobiales bacterium]
MPIIYKICSEMLWREAERDGVFRGAPVDVRDGFIHFSTADQLAETARKHFAGQDGLLLIAIDSDSLGPALAWEPSRGRSELFPHLYGELPLTAVERVVPMPLGRDGKHVLPDLST